MCQVVKQVELSVRVPYDAKKFESFIANTWRGGGGVRASCSYSDGRNAVMLLVPADAELMARQLAAAGFSADTRLVVLIGPADRPGLAHQVLPELGAAGIGILYSYASWSEGDGGYVVLKTTDDDRAVRVLEVNKLIRDLAKSKATHAEAA